MAGQLTTTRPTFPKQGQVDWVALSSSTVNFSVGLLARLMKADIHPSTLTFGMALCSSFRLAPEVQNNVKECIDKLKRYGVCNNILWFGFGIKQTVVELASSEEGLSFVTLCCSILTSYDTYYTAQVLRKLGDIHNIPRDFTPSISQWESIIKIFSGIFIGSRFDLVLQSIRRLVYGFPCDVSDLNCGPETFAKVLAELALIQSERTANLTVTGGADCTWFATFAEQVLYLDVVIKEQSGSPIYRSKERKDVMPQITFLNNPEGRPSLHVSQRTSLVSINQRIIQTEVQDHMGKYFCQRSSWSTILRDTFGDDIEKWLMGNFSQYLCICLAFHGSASIIQKWSDKYLDGEQEHYKAMGKIWIGDSKRFIVPDVSKTLARLGIPSGEAFVEKAGSVLPELRPAIQKHRHKYNLDSVGKLHSLPLEIPEEQFLEQFLLDRHHDCGYLRQDHDALRNCR